MINDRAIEHIKKFEGYSRKPYRDTKDKITAGFGHNLDDNPLEGPLYEELFKRVKWNSSREAEEFWTLVLEEDTKWLTHSLSTVFPFYPLLPSQVQVVYIDMLYNIGMPSLRGFKGMHKAVDNEDWDKAAMELMYSQYLFDVKRRAVANAKLMAHNFIRAMEMLGKESDDHYREASKYV